MANKQKLIDKIIDWGCSCDLMVGYSCGCHRIREELESAFKQEENKQKEKK